MRDLTNLKNDADERLGVDAIDEEAQSLENQLEEDENMGVDSDDEGQSYVQSLNDGRL